MRRARRTLRTRLVLSHAAVVAVGAVVLAVTLRLLVPRLFDDRVGSGAGANAGRRGSGPLHEAVVSALNRSLAVAVAVSILAALATAVLTARRILRPIARVRATTRSLASGDYSERVRMPAEAELAALAEDVNVLAATLEETESRRRALVTEVAHELRTPITTITGYLEAFLDGVLAPEPAVLAEVLDEARRLDRLTADLGLLSRLDEGALALTLRRTDLRTLAEQVSGRLRPQFDAGDVRLDVSGEEAEVEADADRVAQIITNLVGNALRYTPPGGTVRVTTAREGGRARCSVTDTGRGLTPEEQDRIFDRFVRGSAADGLPGSGVGLTIARSLARAHGGDVTVRSDGPGRGASFTIDLPAAR